MTPFTWIVFNHYANQPTVRYLVSDPQRAIRDLPGTWIEEAGIWLRLDDTTITHTIVPHIVDHEEIYLEGEGDYRWVLVGN